MHNLIEGGYITHWGVSQWTAVQILNAVRICEKNGWQKPISNQPIYNLLNRSLEVDVMDVCEKEGLGLVVYSPLAQGLLTGKYKQDFAPEGSRMKTEGINQYFPSKRMTPDFFEKMAALEAIAASLNVSMTQLALAWILQKSPITSVIMGASNVNQIKENSSASGVKLDEAAMQQIENILQNAPVDQYSGTRIGYGIIKRGY
jgi:aryl-alcohol dehydrogenase-like predicted oxidoreductase